MAKWHVGEGKMAASCRLASRCCRLETGQLGRPPDSGEPWPGHHPPGQPVQENTSSPAALLLSGNVGRTPLAEAWCRPKPARGLKPLAPPPGVPLEPRAAMEVDA